MSAMEKVAWTELIVSGAAVVAVTALYPLLGSAASGAFGLLGLIVCGAWFLRRRGRRVVVDERDREIDLRAKHLGFGTAWMALFLALIAIVFWSNLYNDRIVATDLLTWLIWIQFAICYGVKGLVGVLAYRRQRRAA